MQNETNSQPRSDYRSPAGNPRSSLSSSQVSSFRPRNSQTNMSTKRKISNVLSSPISKSSRNLSWNGFQNSEVHELSSEDEEDRGKRRAKFACNRPSIRGPTLSRSSFHSRFLNEKPLVNVVDEPGAKGSLSQSESADNHHVWSASRLSSNGARHPRGETEAEVQIQQFAGFKTRIAGPTKLELPNRKATSPTNESRGADKMRSQNRRGTICSPIVIDDTSSTQHDDQTKTFQTCRSDPKPNGVKNGFRKPLRHHWQGSTHDEKSMKDRIPGEIMKSEAASSNRHQTSSISTRGSDILPESATKQSTTESRPKERSYQSIFESSTSRRASGRDIEAHDVQDGGSSLSHKSTLFHCDESEHEEDLQKAMSASLASSRIPGSRDVPLREQGALNKSFFIAKCKQQRQKYRIDEVEPHEIGGLDVSEQQDYNPPSGIYSNASAHGKKDAPTRVDLQSKNTRAPQKEYNLGEVSYRTLETNNTSHAPTGSNGIMNGRVNQSNEAPTRVEDTCSRGRSTGPGMIPKPHSSDIELRNLEAEFEKERNSLRARKQKVADLKKAREESEARRAAELNEQEAALREQATDYRTTSSKATERNTSKSTGAVWHVPALSQISHADKLQEAQKRINRINFIGAEECASLMKARQERVGSKANRPLGQAAKRNHQEHRKTSTASLENERSVVECKKPKNYKAGPIDMEKITEDDWMLVQMCLKGWHLKDIHTKWEELTGSEKSREHLRVRSVRLRHTFPDLFQQDATTVRQRNEETLQRLRNGLENESYSITGDSSVDFTQPGESREAIIARRRAILDSTPPNHSKVGGKRMSEDLQKYILDSLSRQQDDSSDSESDSEAPEVRSGSTEVDEDKIHFAYLVRRRVIKSGQPDQEGEWQVCGDVYTSAREANDAAATEMKVNRGNEDVWPITKWACEMSEQTGLVSYSGTGENGTVQVEVHRFLRNYHDGVMPQSKMGWANRRVFDVIEMRSTFDETIDWEDNVVEETAQPAMGHSTTKGTEFAPSRTSEEDHVMQAAASNDLLRLSEEVSESVSQWLGEQTDTRGELVEVSQNTAQSSGQQKENNTNGADDIDYLFEEMDHEGRALPLPPQIIVRTITRTKIITKKTCVTERAVGGVSAVRDRANRLAGETFLKLQRELDPDPQRRRLTMDNYYVENQARLEMEERLDSMEDNDISFDEEIKGGSDERIDCPAKSEGEGVSARVKVVERMLENPRNF